MIVKVDSINQEQYVVFFSEAYRYLEELEQNENRVILQEQDINKDRTFTSIAQYFKYIEEFKNSEKRDIFLLKLPLDEGMFEIDANSRIINVPASFNKQSIMQKDKIAETLVFTIDRFIDNMDLCNVSNIYIQWTAPNGKGGTREWATPAEFIDRESIPNKIKFGWIIDSVVTEFPGKVSFSATFFTPDENLDKKVSYRLSTLPASFEVKPVLQPEINESTTINRPGNALNRIIRNNNYPGQGVKDPIAPEFTTPPGLDLPLEAALVGEGDGTLTLKAQALLSDEGVVYYDWYYVPEGGEYNYKCGIKGYDENENLEYYSLKFEKLVTNEDSSSFVPNTLKQEDYDMLTEESQDNFYPSEEEDKKGLYLLKGSIQEDERTFIELFYNPIGTVNTIYEEILDETKISSRDRIYVSSSNGTYEPYDKNNEEHKLKTKYEKYTTFTVPEGDVKVVGVYFVNATNSITPNVSAPQSSARCTLSGPSDITFMENGDLNEITFIESSKIYHQDDKISTEDFKLILNTEIIDKLNPYDNEDNIIEKNDIETEVSYYKPKENGVKIILRKTDLELKLNTVDTTPFNYSWYKTLEETSWPEDPVEEESSNKISITSPGWYKAKITTTRNRKTKFEESSICRAVFAPEIPTLEIIEYNEQNKPGTTSQGEWTTIGANNDKYYRINANPNDPVYLVIDGDILVNEESQKNNKLYSDGIQYEWRIYNNAIGAYEVLTSGEKHQNLIPASLGNHLSDEKINNFSNHPKKIVFQFTGNPDSDYYDQYGTAVVACFAINSLGDRQSSHEAIAFLIQ